MLGGPMLMGVVAVGGLLVAAALVLIVAPKSFMAVLQGMDSKTRFRFAILARLGIGGLFVLAAPLSLWPAHIRVLGWILVAAAVGIALMGRKRMDSLIDGVLKWPPWAFRSWGVVALVGGGLLVKAGL